MVDPIGISDGINAVIHIVRGNYMEAAFSAVAISSLVVGAGLAGYYVGERRRRRNQAQARQEALDWLFADPDDDDIDDRLPQPVGENDLDELSETLAHRDLPAGVRAEAAVDEIWAHPAAEIEPAASCALLDPPATAHDRGEERWRGR